MDIIPIGGSVRNSTDLFKSNSLADLRERLKAEHTAAAGALKSSLRHAMAAGDILIEAKEQLKHGHWLPWLQSGVFATEPAAADAVTAAQAERRP
jgi:hypothetical protein